MAQRPSPRTPSAQGDRGQEQIRLRGEFTLLPGGGDGLALLALTPPEVSGAPLILELEAESAPHDFQRFQPRQNSPLDTDVLNKQANRGRSAGCSFIVDTKIMVFFDQMLCYR